MDNQSPLTPSVADQPHAVAAECSAPAASAPRKWRTLLVLLSLLLMAALIYGNSLRAPFIFGDWSMLWGDNTLKNFSTSLAPPTTSELAGRPLAALSFALNFAQGGESPGMYRVVNIALHIFAGILFWLLLNETLARSPRISHRLKDARGSIAWASALLWLAHPLNTETIVYVSRRTELLAALGLLLMLYALARSYRAPLPGAWRALSVAAGLAGSLCGDLMWAAPFIAFLYAAIFFHDSFWQTWVRTRAYWLSLSLLWMVGIWATAASQQRRFGFADVAEFNSHLLASAKGLVTYLQLAFWPASLQLDYGRTPVALAADIWPHLAVVGVLLLAVGYGIFKRAPFAFLGAAGFLLLVPAAFVVPIVLQPIAEHRAYLVTAVIACATMVVLQRLLRGYAPWLAAAAALALGFFTHQRNQVYATESALWEDSIVKNPINARAFLCRAHALERERNLVDALSCYELALIVDPNFAEGHYAYGRRLARNPARQDEAIAHFRETVRIKPTWLEAYLDLGNALLKQPKLRSEAVTAYESALKLQPDSAEIRVNLGNALAFFPQRLAEAFAHFEAAAKLAPNNAHLYSSWGNALVKDPSRWGEARERYEKALVLDPKIAGCHYNLALLLSKEPDGATRAMSHYREAIRLSPDYLEAHYNLALLLRKTPESRVEAIVHFKEALRIDPSLSQAQEMIAKIEAL